MLERERILQLPLYYVHNLSLIKDLIYEYNYMINDPFTKITMFFVTIISADYMYINCKNLLIIIDT